MGRGLTDTTHHVHASSRPEPWFQLDWVVALVRAPIRQRHPHEVCAQHYSCRDVVRTWDEFVKRQARLTCYSSRKLAFCYRTLDVSSVQDETVDRLTDFSGSTGCTGNSQRPVVSLDASEQDRLPTYHPFPPAASRCPASSSSCRHLYY